MERNTQTKTAFVILAAISVAACSEGMPTGPSSAPGLLAQRMEGARAEPSFTFMTIDAPGAALTSPQGINAGGVVSGFYTTGTGSSTRFHGFTWQEGVVTTVDYPEADNTRVRGIGPSGDLVGEHWDVAEVSTANPAPAHGFRRSADGDFEDVHFPGHLYEFPQRILPDGTILGCRHDHDLMGSMRGVRIAREASSEVDAFASMSNGGTPNGQLVVGLYTNQSAGNRQEAYIVEGGVVTPLLVPNSSLTTAWDVNPRGDIVGVYQDASGVHGYMMTAAGFTGIDVPGASATRAFGVNARGDVVGTYVTAGKTHGFLASRVD